MNDDFMPLLAPGSVSDYPIRSVVVCFIFISVAVDILRISSHFRIFGRCSLPNTLQRYRIYSIQQRKFGLFSTLDMNFIERLQQYMAIKGISDNKLTVDAGLSIGLIGKAKKNGKAMNSSNIEKILLAYPDLNPDWLITGRGEMLVGDISSEKPQENNQIFKCQPKGEGIESVTYSSVLPTTETRPRIPLEAAAGCLSMFTESIAEDRCERFPLIPCLPSYDFTIPVKGDSMEPDFKSGDEVACRLVRDGAFIQWGQPHIIDSRDGIILKRIHDRGATILCTSDNTRYGDFEVSKDDIYHLARVVGLVRQY